MRLALFAVALGLLYLAGVRGLLNIVLAALVSLMLSYLLLRRPREQLSQEIAERVAGRLKKDPSTRRPAPLGLDDDAESEDAAVDRATNPPTTAD